ncbi:MAG: carbohydrate-binding family 9-like protein, partial [Deltaproteobacteria bacterium]|nr:carbohydrate-binding family 9-like protein [Deltaproteobacteria bacterium]
MRNSSTTRRLALLAVLACFGSCICVERPKRMTEDERAELRAQILTEPPATMQNRVGADLDGRLELVGYDLDADKDDRGRIVPGRKVAITWYWRCKVPLHEGWRLFTHVTDDTGTNRVRADELGLVRQHYQPSLWREGEVIVDRQEFEIPADFNSKTVTFYVGAWFGPHRLPVRNNVSSDAGRVRIGPFPMQYDLPATVVPQVNASITTDGRLDEPEWAVAAVLDPFVLAPDGAASDRVRARVLWNSRFLYVAFEVRDPLLVAQFSRRDDAIYDEDAVQVLLDEDGDGADYYDYAASPTGVLYDCALAEPTKGEPKEFTATDFRAGVVLDGTANDAAPDRGYTMELQIPFQALSKFKERSPRAGTTWRANFSVLDMPALAAAGAAPPRQEGFAWSAPQVTNFHVPRRFGELTFGEPVAVPAPAPVVAP